MLQNMFSEKERNNYHCKVSYLYGEPIALKFDFVIGVEYFDAVGWIPTVQVRICAT